MLTEVWAFGILVPGFGVTPMQDHSLYETDFYAWATQQAALLRAGKLVEHVI